MISSSTLDPIQLAELGGLEAWRVPRVLLTVDIIIFQLIFER
jgi:hypothetical protein